ncbi:diuretic hormone receptor-like [Onthophagus taurus]|uniref:diuretic hormone receptor-like n=1 Tax=Onthophagus taurus TaxID=166361 RepID=UPI000C200E07|nr:diuretic hormone receptor-like [Onthophagus taurus]XP_022911146.1 diuretic hormone receptor-like [Onthophagus taurus]
MERVLEKLMEGVDELRLVNINRQNNDSFTVCEEKKLSSSSKSGELDGCEVMFDSILCWPQTPPNTTAVLPCFDQFNGIRYDSKNNATRFCNSDNTWDKYADFKNCTELMEEEHEVELTTTIYLCGYSISLVALIIAVYIFIRYKDLRCLRNSIHMNLMISYIFSNFIWILTLLVQVSLPSSKVSCVFLLLLLHYFHLTNFFWMFVEGLYLYILVAKAFAGENIRWCLYAFIGWGAPGIFVVIWGIARTISIFLEDWDNRELQHQRNGIKTCPWAPHPLDWIYQLPAVLVLLANLIFLFVIMWVLITKLRSATNVETQQYRKAAKALLVLIPLLGITYILMIMGPTQGVSKQIYEYVRAGMLSIQGFSVAFFYCFMNAEVKNTVQHHFRSWHTTRSLGSRRTRYSSRDFSSPKFKDSLRLYHAGGLFKKRESATSVGTTTTLISIPTHRNSSPQIRCPLLPPATNETG